jgi:hypothetical protein
MFAVYQKESSMLCHLLCVHLAVFVGVASAREESSGLHLCAGLDKSIAHRLG